MPQRALILPPPLARTAYDAAKLATALHSGQTDKIGEPYALHLGRVAVGLARLARGCPFWSTEERDAAAQIAWLHDAVEDHKITEGGLFDEGFASQVVYAVALLTKERGVPYADFIAGICRGPFLSAILVKLADVADNSHPARLAILPPQTADRLRRKYAGAADVLREAARSKGWLGPA